MSNIRAGSTVNYRGFPHYVLSINTFGQIEAVNETLGGLVRLHEVECTLVSDSAHIGKVTDLPVVEESWG